jgi:hypothetical protein
MAAGWFRTSKKQNPNPVAIAQRGTLYPQTNKQQPSSAELAQKKFPLTKQTARGRTAFLVHHLVNMLTHRVERNNLGTDTFFFFLICKKKAFWVPAFMAEAASLLGDLGSAQWLVVVMFLTMLMQQRWQQQQHRACKPIS